MSYIKIDRKILDWEWWSDINTSRVFTYCLIRANWKESKFQGVDIPRGAFVTSLANLAKFTNLSVRQVRTALEHLKSTGELTIIRHSKFSVVIVNNYVLYQDSDNQIDNQLTQERQAIDTEATTEEEYKKNNKKNKENNIRDYFSKDPILKDAFKDYCEMRQKKKKPLTDRAVKMLITALEKLSTDPAVQIDLLDQATFKGWESVYPLQNWFVSSRQKPEMKKEESKIVPIKRDMVVTLNEDDSNSQEWETDRKRHPFEAGWRIDDDGYWVNVNV